MKRENVAVDGADVEIERRPAVLRDGDQALVQFNLRGAQVGLMAGAIAHADERVHFFRAKADDAARAVILEAAAEHALAVGDERPRRPCRPRSP